MKPLLFLRGRCLFSGPLSPSRPRPVLGFYLPVFFFFLYGLCRRRRVFSLSLSQALGNPKPFWFGVPLVFLQPGHALRASIRTSSSSSTPRHCPAPVFFLSSSLVSGSVFARPGSVGVGFLGGCFFLSLVSVFPLCVALQDRPRHF